MVWLNVVLPMRWRIWWAVRDVFGNFRRFFMKSFLGVRYGGRGAGGAGVCRFVVREAVGAAGE